MYEEGERLRLTGARGAFCREQMNGRAVGGGMREADGGKELREILPDALEPGFAIG